MPSRKLSSKEVEVVLRRAAEIDAGGADGPARHDDGELSVTDVYKLGDEAGLAPESVQRALSEMRRGLMAPPAEDGDAVTRTLGASRILVSREVPGSPEPVRRAVERFMHDQLMTVRRHHGERVEWERAQGIFPGLVRSLDFSRRYDFGLVSHVETLVASDDDGSTSVTFQIDIGEMRRERLTSMAMRSAIAFALIGLGGAALFSGFGVNDLLALTGGGAAAGGVLALERRKFLAHRSRVALAPERFLDLLVQKRKRALLNSP